MKSLTFIYQVIDRNGVTGETCIDIDLCEENFNKLIKGSGSSKLALIEYINNIIIQLESLKGRAMIGKYYDMIVNYED